MNRLHKIFQLKTSAPEETRKIGEMFAEAAVNRTDAWASYGLSVLLKGELGAGKTCFVKGVGDYLLSGERITSPSYTIIKEYDSYPVQLVHADLYRIDSHEQIHHTGLLEYPRPKTLFLVEWPELIEDSWPQYIMPEISRSGKNKRHISFGARGETEKFLIEELKNCYESGRD